MTLEAIRELHYKVDIRLHASSFTEFEDSFEDLSTGHMGLQLDGSLATGRVVTRITIEGCVDRQDQEVRGVPSKVWWICRLVEKTFSPLYRSTTKYV